jgi:hypothetical protein
MEYPTEWTIVYGDEDAAPLEKGIGEEDKERGEIEPTSRPVSSNP